MATYDFTRLKRLSTIYTVVQICMLGLLLYMSYNFMLQFAKYALHGYFIRSLGFAVAIQMLFLFPAWWLAGRDVQVEIEGCLVGITDEQLLALRRRRLLSDIWKLAAISAFVVFVALAPGAEKDRALSFVLAVAYFAFLLVSITYFQCFNYIAKKRRKVLS